MFRYYFKTGLRSLSKNAFYTLLNLAGLTIGLTIGILVLLWVQDELSFDKFHKDPDQIVKTYLEIGSPEHHQILDVIPPPLATIAKSKFPEVKDFTRTRKCYEYTFLKFKDKQFSSDNSSFVDPSFFKIFNFKFIQGRPETAFANPNSIILTKSLAEKLFGKQNPVGKNLSANNKVSLAVSGVIEDFPKNSSFQFDFLMPMSHFVALQRAGGEKTAFDEDWQVFQCEIYMRVLQGVKLNELESKLDKIGLGNSPNPLVRYLLQPLTHLHLYEPDGTAPRLKIVRIFIGVAFFILLIASINYVNLSTARAILRTKEVSIRKIAGAGKWQLFFQFVLETTSLFCIAVFLSFLCIYLLMPGYNELTEKNLVFNLVQGNVWLTISLTLLGTLLASCIYPAILMASFRPQTTLKGSSGHQPGGILFRKVLVVTQFVFSIALIVGTMLINKQLRYIHEKELGYNKQHIFDSWVNSDVISHYLSLKTELLRQPEIESVCSSQEAITEITGSTTGINWENKKNDGSMMTSISIDQNFIPVFKIKMLQGNNFDGSKADSTHFILNETALGQTGMKTPIGKKFNLLGVEGTIIGIVKDFHLESLKTKIKPVVLCSWPSNNGVLYVKSRAGKEAQAIRSTEKILKPYSHGLPFNYGFLDADFDRFYSSDQTTGTLFSIFASIAIFISCLGLFGLTAFSTEVKTKEIGIRKVLGASISSIVVLIASDFTRLIILAIAISTPLAWVLMNNWLADFAYHISIPVWVFIAAGASALLIAGLTISFHSIKAARANPVKSLRVN